MVDHAQGWRAVGGRAVPCRAEQHSGSPCRLPTRGGASAAPAGLAGSVPLRHSAAARIGLSTLVLRAARTHKQKHDKLARTTPLLSKQSLPSLLLGLSLGRDRRRVGSGLRRLRVPSQPHWVLPAAVELLCQLNHGRTLIEVDSNDSPPDPALAGAALDPAAQEGRAPDLAVHGRTRGKGGDPVVD